MAPKNRDDFSDKVKIKAAQRTGYRCSYCSISTIGPSHESSDATSSIGEAAHICAAAPGGKRYDPTMTPEERASIENCIWMCKIHARLIDTDETKYTVDYLKEMKRKAEKFAEDEISELGIYRKSYNESGDNTSSLHKHFRQMIEEGSFDLLRNMLESYTSTISTVYDEFVLRFKIIYALHCNHSLLPEYVDKYITLPSHTGADEILAFAIPFEHKELIGSLLPFSADEELQKICQALLDGYLESSLIIKTEAQPSTFGIAKNKEALINSYILQRIVEKKIFYIQHIDGTDIQCKSNDRYFELLFAAFRLGRKVVYENADIISDPTNTEYWQLRQSANIITQLDYHLQEILWEPMLQFSFGDSRKFYSLISEIPLCVAELQRISKYQWLYKLHYDFSSINIDELLTFSHEINDYSLISRYLWMLPEQVRYEYLKEHLYLCRKSSCFLKMIDHYEEKHNICTLDLNHYADEMKNDFLFHCLCYKRATETADKQTIVSWLLEHQRQIMAEDLEIYIDILADANMWDNLVELSSLCVFNEAKFLVANRLIHCGNNAYISKGLQIYHKLESMNWTHRGLFFNIAVASQNTGKTETAKKYLKKEYDWYKDQTALYHFLRLRIDTNDVIDDEYLSEAKCIITKDFQSIVAASYEKLKQHKEVKKHVLRVLLLDDSASCFGALYSPYDNDTVRDIEYVQENTVCVLSSSSSTINVAIHDDSIIQNFNPNHFANCFHYSVGDVEISSLLYSKCNDTVTFQSNEYTVSKIISSSEFFSAYAMQRLITEGKSVETFSAQDPNSFLEQIKTRLLTSQQQADAIVSDYNSAQIRYPISVLASLLGRERIEICEFLAYVNVEKTRNNTNIHQSSDDMVYILSFDAVINLAMMSAFSMIPSDINILCPYQVRKQLLGDVSEILEDINRKNTCGSLYIVDDRPVFSKRTSTFKRSRHAFLSSIKSFVSSLPETEAYDYESDDGELASIFTESKMGIEAGTLAILQNTPSAVLVTDDEFLYSLATMIGRKTVGLCGFLASICNDSQQLLSFSKKAKEINFANYIPLFLFDKIIDALSLIPEQEELEKANDDLVKWLISDNNDGDASNYHRNLILQLYKDRVAQMGGPLSIDDPLTKIAIHHYAMLNPDFVRQAAEEYAKNITISIEDSIEASEDENE